MKFRTWYVPQIPMKAFFVETTNAIEAEKVLRKALGLDASWEI